MNTTRWIFLGGPIMYRLSVEGHDRALSSVVKSTINLLKTEGYRVRSALTERYLSQRMPLDTGASSERVVRDYSGIVKAKCYIGLWPSANGIPVRSDGMCIEIGWATQAGIPCILIRDMAATYSDMITGLGGLFSVQHIDYREFLADKSRLLPLLEASLAR